MLVDLEQLVRRAVERSQGPDGGVVLDYASLKFSPRGAPVSVQVNGSAGERFVTIAVEDRGSGVPDADLARIFERFLRPTQTPRAPGSLFRS